MSEIRNLTKKQRVAIYFMSAMGKSLSDIAAYYNVSAYDVIRIIQYYESIQEHTRECQG